MHSVAWLKFYISTFLKSSFILRTTHPWKSIVPWLRPLLTRVCRPLVLLSSVYTRLTNILPRVAIICLQPMGSGHEGALTPSVRRRAGGLMRPEKVCRINQGGPLPSLPSGLQWSICQHWDDWWNNEICIFSIYPDGYAPYLTYFRERTEEGKGDLQDSFCVIIITPSSDSFYFHYFLFWVKWWHSHVWTQNDIFFSEKFWSGSRGPGKLLTFILMDRSFGAKLSNLVGFYHEKNWEWTAGIFAQLVPDLLFGYCMFFSRILKIFNV